MNNHLAEHLAGYHSEELRLAATRPDALMRHELRLARKSRGGRMARWSRRRTR